MRSALVNGAPSTVYRRRFLAVHFAYCCGMCIAAFSPCALTPVLAARDGREVGDIGSFVLLRMRIF